MTERQKAFWLGFFIIGATGLLIALLLFLRPTAGDAGQMLRVRFSNVEKVNLGTQVTYAGRPVGEVKAIREIIDARAYPPDSKGNYYFYEIDLLVDSSVKIYTYDEIVFSSAGLLGEKTIAIIPKAPPKGAPAATERTTDILYARSTDKVEQAIAEMTSVAEELNDFLRKNERLTRETLCALKEASETLCVAMRKADHVFSQVIDYQLIEKFNCTLTATSDIACKIASGEGTLGRLIYSDNFYLQITSVMARLEMTLSDINRYGLLFQYDRGWQREQRMRLP